MAKALLMLLTSVNFKSIVDVALWGGNTYLCKIILPFISFCWYWC